jgi:hypothetical protein
MDGQMKQKLFDEIAGPITDIHRKLLVLMNGNNINEKQERCFEKAINGLAIWREGELSRLIKSFEE